ncbi:unnamed protein product [Notodromas monacha]|uniref:Methyltransferase FkbM domain-containing protein n=1 Tax=Notodromas monacha TaxID=399045 RepID=A0A7R9BYQ3_9CRUS|nr:unnamed protein product [Notodromas monacha]CAG0923041.1 unnamed protein product [Notodromas monacha]
MFLIGWILSKCRRFNPLFALLLMCIVYMTYQHAPESRKSVEQVSDPISKELQLLIDEQFLNIGPLQLEGHQFDLSAAGQSKLVAKVFKNKTGGTYVEAGAHNGLSESNTVYLEMALGWTGLLVEPNPEYFQNLTRLRRRTRVLNACISPSNKKNTLDIERKNMGQFLSLRDTNFQATCYPLFNILEAAGLLKLDVLFLDVDGVEKSILDGFPWHLADISMLFTECNPPGPLECEHLTDPLVQTMAKYGYKNISQIGNDVVFLKNGIEF